MAKKTIVFLSLAYSPSIGGAEKQAQLIAESWAAAGTPILIITRRLAGVPHEEMLNGVRVLRIPSLWLPGLSWITFSASALARLVPMRKEISCMIGIMLNPGTMPGAVLARVFGIPLILRPSAGGLGGNIQTLRRSRSGSAKLSLLFGAAAYVVAMNGEVAQELTDAGVSAGKIRIIPNGVDLDLFTPAVPEVRARRRQELGLTDERPVVLFVGRLENVKNLDGLFTAWKAVNNELRDARLYLVGEGSERGALELIIRDLGLQDSVRLEGAKSDLAPYYQAADLFILPSHREGISNALLEAMACGLTPIASRAGGNREILEGFAPDLLIDPGVPVEWKPLLLSLLKDGPRREILGRRAREFIEAHFSSESMKMQYGELVQNVTSPFFRRPFPILAYHRVLPVPAYGIDVSVDAFEKQMAWLARSGYRTMTLRECSDFWEDPQTRAWPTRSIVLTFDDGHREFYDHALPILRRFGFTATIFVNTGLLGQKFWVEGRRPALVTWHRSRPPLYREPSAEWRTYEFMTWDQVSELAKNGFDIESHAVTHPFLTDLPDAQLREELVNSKKTLEDRLKRDINLFCYPSGDFDLRVQTAARAAGYEGAVYSPGHDQIRYYWDDSMALERIGVWQDVAFWKFKALVQGWYAAIHQSTPKGIWTFLRWFYRGVHG